MSGRNIGRFAAASVTVNDSAVWLATCPRLSPVMSAFACTSSAMIFAILIINLLVSMVPSFSGALLLIAICAGSKFTVRTSKLPTYSAS